MTREAEREQLLEFLDTIRRPERDPLEIGDCDSLVESGLIDSLALLEIVAYLEREYGLDFRERGVDPDELASIGGILDLIASGRE